MLDLTERECEVVRLYEQDGHTYAEIAKLLSLAPSRISQIYRGVLRKRREEKRNEFYAQENTHKIAVDMTLGEAIALRHILLDYQRARESLKGRLPSVLKPPEKPDTDYLTAVKFYMRLADIDEQARAALHRGGTE